MLQKKHRSPTPALKKPWPYGGWASWLKANFKMGAADSRCTVGVSFPSGDVDWKFSPNFLRERMAVIVSQWLWSFLEGRTEACAGGLLFNTLVVGLWCPSVLSPMLFDIYMKLLGEVL